MFCRLCQDCMGRYAKARNHLLEGNMENALPPSGSVPSNTKGNVLKSRGIWTTSHRSAYSEYLPVSYPQTSNEINFPIQINVQQRNNETQSKILHRNRLKMESWERNQLHAIFPPDDLRLQQQQKRTVSYIKAFWKQMLTIRREITI
jgi:hypothetical protein